MAEFIELIDNCTWTWTMLKGVDGYKVESKKNGNSIFLPAAGDRLGPRLSGAGEVGRYWSSKSYRDDSDCAYSLEFDSYGHRMFGSGRYRGRTVRSVSEF